MNHKILCLLLLCLPYSLIAQGINWTTGLSWQQVKEKAKQENKYILVDCYATWCVPCKQMDMNVYPDAKVGETYNKNFISIRVQANNVDDDPEEVRKWYSDAKNLIEEFRVVSYPTFLFFSPNGKLVHRVSGGLDTEKFRGLAEKALNEKGYVWQLENFKRGHYDSLNLKELALATKYGGNDSLAKVIATKYVELTQVLTLIEQENLLFLFNFGEDDKEWAKKVCLPKLQELSIEQLANVETIRFLLYAARNDSLVGKATDFWIRKLKRNEILEKSNLIYLKGFMRHSYDSAFKFLLGNKKLVDRVMSKKNWAQDDLDDIILKEEYYRPTYSPKNKIVESGSNMSIVKEPDWKKIQNNIIEKYGVACAERLQFRSKIDWYNFVGNKRLYTYFLVKEMDRTKGWNLHGFALNNSAMQVFWYSRNKKEIKRAAYWMMRYFDNNPKEFVGDAGKLDTYACLLYKAGEIRKSLQLEEKAASIDPSDQEIANNLYGMKRGLPIWPEGYNVLP